MFSQEQRQHILRKKHFGIILLISVCLLSLAIFSLINDYANRRTLSSYRLFLYNIIDKTAEVINDRYFLNDALYEQYLENGTLDLNGLLEEIQKLSSLFLDIELVEKPTVLSMRDYAIRTEGTELFFNFKISNSDGSRYIRDRYVQVAYDLETTLSNLQILKDFSLTTSPESYLLAYGLRVKPRNLPVSVNQIILSVLISLLIYIIYKRIINRFRSYLYNSEGLETIIYLFEKTEEYSANHSRNVAEISHFLGQKYGLRGKRLKDLKVAAYLHDIGKISVPVEILNKDSALSKDEFGEIKKHVHYSAEIIEHFDSLKHLKDFILYHHEKNDGSGYPDGLLEDQIPLESRIIAVADIFEALVGQRPYRSSLNRKDAIKIMRDMPIDAKVLSILIFNVDEVCTRIRHRKKSRSENGGSHFLRFQ